MQIFFQFKRWINVGWLLLLVFPINGYSALTQEQVTALEDKIARATNASEFRTFAPSLTTEAMSRLSSQAIARLLCKTYLDLVQIEAIPPLRIHDIFIHSYNHKQSRPDSESSRILDGKLTSLISRLTRNQLSQLIFSRYRCLTSDQVVALLPWIHSINDTTAIRVIAERYGSDISPEIAQKMTAQQVFALAWSLSGPKESGELSENVKSLLEKCAFAKIPVERISRIAYESAKGLSVIIGKNFIESLSFEKMRTLERGALAQVLQSPDLTSFQIQALSPETIQRFSSSYPFPPSVVPLLSAGQIRALHVSDMRSSYEVRRSSWLAALTPTQIPHLIASQLNTLSEADIRDYLRPETVTALTAGQIEGLLHSQTRALIRAHGEHLLPTQILAFSSTLKDYIRIQNLTPLLSNFNLLTPAQQRLFTEVQSSVAEDPGVVPLLPESTEISPTSQQFEEWKRDAVERSDRRAIGDALTHLRSGQGVGNSGWSNRETVMRIHRSHQFLVSIDKLDKRYPQALPNEAYVLWSLQNLIRNKDAGAGENMGLQKEAASRFLDRVLTGEFSEISHEDLHLSLPQFLALSWYAGHDPEFYPTQKDREDQEWALIVSLANIQRAHNDNEQGRIEWDLRRQPDFVSCMPGTWVRPVESLEGSHLDVVLTTVSNSVIMENVRRISRETFPDYFRRLDPMDKRVLREAAEDYDFDKLKSVSGLLGYHDKLKKAAKLQIPLASVEQVDSIINNDSFMALINDIIEDLPNQRQRT